MKSKTYTYDFNGQVIIIKKTKANKLPPAVYPLQYIFFILTIISLVTT